MISDFKRNIGDIERKINLGEVVLTKFLDLDEQKDLDALKNRYVVNVFGGYSSAEKVRALININNPKISNYSIIAYQIVYPKNLRISHRNVLGTLMSLGIKRNTFGDIIITDDECFLIVTTEISEFIEAEFKKINNYPIELVKISYQKLEDKVQKEANGKTIIVPSLRLDVIVANGFNLSRKDALDLINSKMVFVNNLEMTKPDYIVNEQKIISVRKHGRIKIIEIGKITKKNKIVLTVEIYN